MSVNNKNFLYLSNSQMKCLSLSWCKFVIDLAMFVIDLVYVCHWLYTGRQKKSCHRIIQVIVVDLVFADLSEHQLHIY